MKTIVRMLALAPFLVSAAGTAAEPKSDPASAPVACYQHVWGSKDNPGLGLSRGQAIELCSGVTDANRVIRCFTEAWVTSVDDGGLELSAGQAIELCKANSQLVGGMP